MLERWQQSHVLRIAVQLERLWKNIVARLPPCLDQAPLRVAFMAARRSSARKRLARFQEFEARRDWLGHAASLLTELTFAGGARALAKVGAGASASSVAHCAGVRRRPGMRAWAPQAGHRARGGCSVGFAAGGGDTSASIS